MKQAVAVVAVGMMWNTLAAGAELAGCGLSKGLYQGWLGLAKTAPAHSHGPGAIVAGVPTAGPDSKDQDAIGKEYRAFIRCLSDTAERLDRSAVLAKCGEVQPDRIASLACQTAIYLKSGRTASKEFLDSLPAKKGAEAIWDLDAIAGRPDDAATIFLPNGPAYKLVDELFLLVLDDKETAAAKYLNVAALATGDAERHIDEQIKLLMRESPAVIVKRWMLFRQYQPKLKRVLADMMANLSAAEVQKMRKGFGAFCTKDNPDCPEIARLVGKFE
jgi:hypothetical protein